MCFVSLFHCLTKKSQDWRVDKKKVVMTVSTTHLQFLIVFHYQFVPPIKFSMCSHQVPNVFPPCSHNPRCQNWQYLLQQMFLFLAKSPHLVTKRKRQCKSGFFWKKLAFSSLMLFQGFTNLLRMWEEHEKKRRRFKEKEILIA